MKKPIDTAALKRAAETLRTYKAAKQSLENRIVENERWYKLRHWEVLRRASDKGRQEPVSAWLFSSIASKHADAMDAFPSPTVLPREESDRDTANQLSQVLPVIMERNHFEQTYSDCWWYKLKNGTAVYGVFWDNSLDCGIGDISIKKLDLLNVFWQPGITDISQSRNLFIVDLKDTDLLLEEYPQLRKEKTRKLIDVKEYVFDESVSADDKTLVVDWYYKKKQGGRTVLHYCKFVGDTLLYASENDELYAERGYYDHGQYPVVFDVLFPEEGTPVGFGYVDIMKDPQAYIDRLSQVIMENAVMTSKPRFFIRKNAGLNPDEFLDWSKPLVEVEGEPDESKVRQIVASPVSPIATSMLQMKIDELKETGHAREFSQGSVTGGVTAASAIIALQEAGSKVSRDIIQSAYRAYARISETAVELIRQFYGEGRVFRITAENQPFFLSFSNGGMLTKELPSPDGGIWLRRPTFDVRISAEKKSPFSRLEQNELAKELFALGFFRTENRDAALLALRLLEFEGKDAVINAMSEPSAI